MNYFHKALALFFILAGLKMAVTLPGTAIELFQQQEVLRGVAYTLGWGFYLLSIYAGVALWRDKPIGIVLGVGLLVPQALSFAWGGFAYRLTSLFDFFLYYESGTPFGLDGYAGGRLTFGMADAAGELMIGINLVAIALLIRLARELRSRRMAELSPSVT